jgi:hypothetical protein
MKSHGIKKNAQPASGMTTRRDTQSNMSSPSKKGKTAKKKDADAASVCSRGDSILDEFEARIANRWAFIDHEFERSGTGSVRQSTYQAGDAGNGADDESSKRKDFEPTGYELMEQSKF